ncbi:hypothetical protein A3C28_01640 [Candidatus Roizmanbacteria bacterium RIFCSPHIGHO2_02_FULL_39_9]|uniref:Triosephosphate isomerase n=2 Tax=Candidatus Roizmaniibacteriota TaxID=1752723 RepID=A0A1F7HW37_9BACT|nr:MAG: hypothetical protein A3C28_01640 [Candidatus Roizmanbacteria bacterium RIFCSPHIGHO2_02_FULL_39_9]OGK35072.1 MAG: hypothetical protein A3F60_03240 [Candidatus Roizmanbacteria bacterium RIFCSPHIGHO2_12_FULL_39_8]
MRYFIANWKARKNLKEGYDWFEAFSARINSNQNLNTTLHNGEVKIIVCPPHPLISPLKEKFGDRLPIYFGAQDVSQFEEGSYTGEVTAKSLEGLVNYVIVGHSERRRYLNETNEMIINKIIQAKKYNIEPILCVRNQEDLPLKNVDIISYEPVQAIGTGKNEDPKDILGMKKRLQIPRSTVFFYGGSVNKTTILDYLKTDEINGFLIGTASNDPLDFYNIVSTAILKK